jgi:hypothetical protein
LPAVGATGFGGFVGVIRAFSSVRVEHADAISHKVCLKSFCKNQFPHKFVNLFFVLVIVKDKLTDLWGG